MAFIKDPKDPRNHLWQHKPKTPAQVRRDTPDFKAAALARRTPTSQRQELLSSKATKK
jgi:hypothetical protein